VVETFGVARLFAQVAALRREREVVSLLVHLISPIYLKQK
jgi:hypothetical protein